MFITVLLADPNKSLETTEIILNFDTVGWLRKVEGKGTMIFLAGSRKLIVEPRYEELEGLLTNGNRVHPHIRNRQPVKLEPVESAADEPSVARTEDEKPALSTLGFSDA